MFYINPFDYTCEYALLFFFFFSIYLYLWMTWIIIKSHLGDNLIYLVWTFFLVFNTARLFLYTFCVIALPLLLRFFGRRANFTRFIAWNSIKWAMWIEVIAYTYSTYRCANDETWAWKKIQSALYWWCVACKLK